MASYYRLVLRPPPGNDDKRMDSTCKRPNSQERATGLTIKLDFSSKAPPSTLFSGRPERPLHKLPAPYPFCEMVITCSEDLFTVSDQLLSPAGSSRSVAMPRGRNRCPMNSSARIPKAL